VAFGSCLSYDVVDGKDTMRKILRLFELIKSFVIEQVGDVSFMRGVSRAIKGILLSIIETKEAIILKDHSIFDMFSALLKRHSEDIIITRTLTESLVTMTEVIICGDLFANYGSWVESGHDNDEFDNDCKIWEAFVKGLCVPNGLCDLVVFLSRNSRVDAEARENAQTFIQWLMQEENHARPCRERLTVLLDNGSSVGAEVKATETE
jgi:hypothetical protein